MGVSEATDGLEILMAPDPHSRSKEHDGRRIIEVESGDWYVVNLLQIRGLRSPRQAAEAARKAEQRNRKKEGKSRPRGAPKKAKPVREPWEDPAQTEQEKRDTHAYDAAAGHHPVWVPEQG